MFKQNLIIINHNTLYEILDEIKKNLSFIVVRCEDEYDFIKNSNLDIKNSLFISKSSDKLLLNKSITEKNLLNFNIFPLPLRKLIELINIQFIKLKFNQQSKVNIKGYELNLNSKFFLKNELSLKLTEKEIEIILYLKDKKKNCDVLDLQKNIWGYSPDMETHTVETHIYRLRKKITNKFHDEDFILSQKNGYFIE
ncbi:helix-turn-helix domain-containing protein [Candidatus Pelagibacter sp. Uisw_127]|uniref:helix-turn-helix domain-containing protein n=1 Tax=Candidatus Pelagibacter sp. Uisw_127 TaxID=3230988 RepID=UPI0039E81EC5